MGHTLSDHLVMVGIAADQHPERDDAVKFSGSRQARHRPRHLVRAGHANDRQALYARGPQAGRQPVQQAVHQRFVEARRADADAKFRTVDPAG